MTTKHPDAALIQDLGGPAELARKLGYDARLGVPRVHNWTTRGIPEVVRLRRPDLFSLPLQARSAA